MGQTPTPILTLILILFSICIYSLPTPIHFSNYGEQIPGPSSPSNFSSWFQAIMQWRTTTLKEVNYNSEVYDDVASLKWTQSSFIQPQMMVHERMFFDKDNYIYTVDKYAVHQSLATTHHSSLIIHHDC